MYAKSIKYEIGRSYCEDEFVGENSKYIANEYSKIISITNVLFNHIPFKVEFTEKDPYESSKELREKVLATGIIKIYTLSSPHPFITNEENNRFRAVHDVFAHCVCGCPFTFEGEYSAYLEQRKYYPKSTWRLMFTEIPAQTCAYYYKRSFDFEQRAFEAPSYWLEMCKGIEKDYSENSILDPLYNRHTTANMRRA